MQQDTITGQKGANTAEYPFSPYGRFRSLLNSALYGALGIHTLFIILFYLHKVYLLSLVNVGSVLIYIVALFLVKRQEDRPAIFLAWLEILGHAAICTVVIGFETGFHYYVIVLLPFVFVNASRSTLSKVSGAVFLGVVYVALVYFSDILPPINHLNEQSIKVMRYINIVVCLSMIGMQSHIYSRSVIDGENELKQSNKDLQKAIDEVKTLRGILPICSFCKKIRDDKGYWERVDVYIGHHSDADISHSICPDCMKKHYPDYTEKVEEVENT